MKTRQSIVSFAVALFLVGAAFGEEAKALPEAAKKLKQAYNQQVQAAVAIKPIRDRYLADLKKLQEQATEAGKLDEFTALRREIAQVSARGGMQKFIGQYRSSAGGTITLRDDGSTYHSSGRAGNWEVEGDEMVIKWNNNYSTGFPISEPGDEMSAWEAFGINKPYSVTLTRLR